MLILDLNNSKTFLDTTKKLRNGLERLQPEYLHISRISMRNILILLNKIFKSNHIVSMSPSPLNVPICIICKILNKKFFVGMHDIVPHEGKKQKEPKFIIFFSQSLHIRLFFFLISPMSKQKNITSYL